MRSNHLLPETRGGFCLIQTLMSTSPPNNTNETRATSHVSSAPDQPTVVTILPFPMCLSVAATETAAVCCQSDDTTLSRQLKADVLIAIYSFCSEIRMMCLPVSSSGSH